jgi:hypothetical protein
MATSQDVAPGGASADLVRADKQGAELRRCVPAAARGRPSAFRAFTWLRMHNPRRAGSRLRYRGLAHTCVRDARTRAKVRLPNDPLRFPSAPGMHARPHRYRKPLPLLGRAPVHADALQGPPPCDLVT